MVEYAVLQLDNIPQFRVSFQSQHDAFVIMLNLELLAESDESNLPLFLKTLQHWVLLVHDIEVMPGIEYVKLEDINAVNIQPHKAVLDGLCDIFSRSHRSAGVQVPALGGNHIIVPGDVLQAVG